MSVVQKNVLVSVEEYLEGEKYAQVKHEYVRGHVYAMVGVSRTHNTLALALASRLLSHLHAGGCRVFISDMKVRIGDIYYYPDVLVTCSKTDADPHFSTEPRLIIEVLSPSTEAFDRLDKRLAYQSLSSLGEYVLVSQERLKCRYTGAAAQAGIWKPTARATWSILCRSSWSFRSARFTATLRSEAAALPCARCDSFAPFHSSQFSKQCCGLLQVARVVTFGEPVVDRLEQIGPPPTAQGQHPFERLIEEMTQHTQKVGRASDVRHWSTVTAPASVCGGQHWELLAAKTAVSAVPWEPGVLQGDDDRQPRQWGSAVRREGG